MADTGNCEKVTYYISGSITHKFLNFLYLDYHSWTYILQVIVNIIFVHLIFEMPPRNDQILPHQQNIWIVTNYAEFKSTTAFTLKAAPCFSSGSGLLDS